MLDAKTAAMGGVGVATDLRNAPFMNPALMATDDENLDWIVMYPSVGSVETEDSGIEDMLDGKIPLEEGATRRLLDSRSFAIVVPNSWLSGVLFYNERVFHSAQINDVGGNNQLRHRAVTVKENGFALGRVMEEPNLPLYGFMVGVNIKLMQFRAYGYDQTIPEDAVIDLDTGAFASTTSIINFDLGISRELGVWKMGLVVKDIFKLDNEYGDSKERYSVLPQARMGLAYRSRKTFWEIDMDLNKNSEISTHSESQYMAIGWEYQLIRPLKIRLGYRSNSVGDKLQTQTAGIGLKVGMFEYDVAALKNGDESGMFSQLILRF